MKNTFVILILSLMNCCIVFAGEKQPNVVVFLVDDLRTELACYGSQTVKSPHIDALAKDGVRFTNAYCQEAICAPSRMSILTGLRPETIGIYSIFTPLRKKHKDMVTMPQFFKKNGYTTVSVGKVYHHTNDDKESWSIHIPKENNSWVKPANIALIDSLNKAGVKRNGPAYECVDVEDDAYKDGRSANHAITALRKIKNDRFLMFVGMSKPHLPFNAPKKYWDLYDKNDFVVPAREEPKGMNKLALTSWGELRGYYGIPEEGHLDDATTIDLIHGYHACVSYIDAQIGKVMKALEDLGLRENTMVILMSDHGWKLGEYGAWCKHTNFELDVNVPLIVSRETSNEKRKTNVTSDALVENVDLFATLADYCGFATHPLEGKSFLPLLDRPNKKWDSAAYSLYPRGEKYMGCTCSDGEWRYTEWRNINGEVGVELYNHSASSLANENFSGTPKFKKVEKRMKQLLEVQFPSDRKSFYTENDD